jgi:hypothetical protein
MRRQERSQIRFSPQVAHDLGDRPFGKNALSLKPQRQEIGQHFTKQRRLQTITLELHGAKLENRFHNLALSALWADFFVINRTITSSQQ